MAAIDQFAKKHGFEKAPGGGYRGRVEGTQVELTGDTALEVAVRIRGKLPEGLEVKLTKVAPRNRVRLWQENREMDPQFFDEFASFTAKSAIDLQDYLADDRVKKLLRQVFWIGKMGIAGGKLVYARFGDAPGLEFLEQLVGTMVAVASRLGQM